MVTVVSVRDIQAHDLFLGRLPRKAREAFLFCATLPIFKKNQWYLAGGTALALQVGHRQSVDLDFFTPKTSFRETSMERELFATNGWQTSLLEKGTIYGTLKGAKLSFIAYPFFHPSQKMLQYGTVRILAADDIASMKMIAISQRGRKRDFIDLFWYCTNRGQLHSVIERAVTQYPGQKHNITHFLKGLTYFADADADPMPRMYFRATWKEIKRYFQTQVPQITKKLLGLR